MKRFALGLAAIVLSAVVAAPSQALLVGNVPLYFPTITGLASSPSTTVGTASTAPTLAFTGNGTATTSPTAAAPLLAFFQPPLTTITSALFQFSYAGFNNNGTGSVLFDILRNGTSIFGGPTTAVGFLAPASGESGVINLLSLVNANSGNDTLAFFYGTTDGAAVNITSAFQLGFTTIPEPTTMAGLFVFGAVVATRKKLAKKAAV
jgi:hypothetical protein